MVVETPCLTWFFVLVCLISALCLSPDDISKNKGAVIFFLGAAIYICACYDLVSVY